MDGTVCWAWDGMAWAEVKAEEEAESKRMNGHEWKSKQEQANEQMSKLTKEQATQQQTM